MINGETPDRIPNDENQNAAATRQQPEAAGANGTAGAPTPSSDNEPVDIGTDTFPDTGGLPPGGKSRKSKPEARGKKKFGIGRILALLGIILLGWLMFTVVRLYVTPDRNLRQIYLVPPDAAVIIQSSEPVRDWQRFSSSEPWRRLMQAPSFAEMTGAINALDSTIRGNKTLLSLVGKRDMTISLHKTRTRDFDFLIVVDLRKASKLEMLKDQMENLLKLAGNDVTRRKYNGVNILEMKDVASGDVLYCAFVDNHFAASYSPALIHAAIDEREKPQIGLEYSFLEAEKLVGSRGLYRIFLNYSCLPEFLSIYLGSIDETLASVFNSMEFAGMWMDSSSEKIELKGYTLIKDVADPYVAALLGSGRSRIKVQDILPARTALFADLGFDNAAAFVRSLEQAMEANDAEGYGEYVRIRERLEKYFGISLEDDFLGWMSGEFAYIQLEPGLLGLRPETLLAVRARSIREARKSMAHIEKRIRGRSPIRISSVDYKGYDINYVEMKGFFRLFFGKLFDRFETPYYTYVDDYVVFSMSAASLLSFVEDIEQKNLLKNDPEFKKAMSRVSSSSTFFAYVDTHRFYPQLQGMLSPQTWRDVEANRHVLYGFPRATLQVSDEKGKVSLNAIIEHAQYDGDGSPVPTAMEPDDPDDPATEDRDQSEKELMSELKRFYVEKFEGNVLCEYYDDGALMSESEVKDGKRHGHYREFYPGGTLRLRGKYSKGQPKGTWKYYTEDGAFDRKERK